MNKKNRSNKLTPGEIIEKYPALEKINITTRYLGVLLKVGLLKGVYNNGQGVAYIEEESLQPLLNFRNSVLDNQKFQI